MANRFAQKSALDGKPNAQFIRFHHDRGIGGHGAGRAFGFSRQQFLRIGMLRIGKDINGLPLFNNFPALHHANPVGNAAHDAQIMRDEQKAKALAAFQIGQKVKDLRLNGHIQRGCRLIRDQQFGAIGQSHGDHHALALAARQLMRISGQAVFGVADADFVQQFDNAGAGSVAFQLLVQAKAFPNLGFDRVQRVQRCHRLLKDKADVISAHRPQGFFRRANHFAAQICDRSGHQRTVWQQAHGGQRRHRFARPAFPDNRHSFAFAHGKADTAHGMNIVSILTKADIQVFNRQNHVHLKVFLGSNASRTPSKMNTSRDSMMAKVKNVVKASDGICRFCWAWRDSWPSDGRDAGSPKPR